MNIIELVAQWFADPAQWSGPAGIPVRLAEHLAYTGLTLLIAGAIAVPIGMYVGHTGKGRIAVVGAASALRALPTLGLLTLFVLLMGLGLMPPIWALVILTIPPLLAGAYSGIAAVDPTLVDAARGLGMTEWQVLAKVELPNALPVLLGGLRAAVLQVIATVAVVAYINLGGLGRYLIDGLAISDPVRMFGGAILIALLALVVDGILAVVQKFAVSPGLADRRRRKRRETPTVGAVQGGM
ncbi:ABC-type proline/glycine betaine transporter, permease [Arthrobacter crystallopoietes BAB-32]|uniref:ABC-type proline/glycine betaine transporter, permease n=1 Tax=Arthrobacter crystallopoietes BAB-32 TaxID=1246476 RepID=N1V2A0_9MICC|nr:ABC transporter permease [Arthrobacter crystallopoietes]EMY35470.1 ABC-type proline/glycine betaine transporter, permease [Arthrobacter crystallopoietes BAB-32]